MHFKLFWMPCLHIKNFTSAPIPELAAVENFTKRWKGILGSQGSLVGFKKSIQIKKDSYQTWLESINQKCGEKSAYRIKSRVSQRSQAIKISFFLLLLLRILVGNSFYMLSDSKFLKNILIGQISSHRCNGLFLACLGIWKLIIESCRGSRWMQSFESAVLACPNRL